MDIGAITGYIDVAQVVLYLFWIFFFGLIYYLRQEDKREGYPLETDRRSDRVAVQGFPPMPRPKTFLLRQGHTYMAPPGNIDRREVKAVPIGPWPGAPLEPTGDPMIDAVGPASYAERDDVPEVTAEGENRIVPLRVARDFFVAPQDPDPRGWSVVTADGLSPGVIREIWVDRSEPAPRYYEVQIEGGRRVLLPYGFARVDTRRRQVRVASVHARHFATVPGLQDPDQITAREEDRITGYFGGGHLYADPSRLGPWL
jgi:photosynthetic reaction center H subunit